MDSSSILLTRAQVREVDRRAIEEYGIPGIVLMENAGRGAAQIIAGLAPAEARIAIVCGRGNNGGDGLVIARHLHIRGFRVELFLCCAPEKLTGDAATNHAIVERIGLPRRAFATAEEISAGAAALHAAGVIVDAVLGTGFSGDVRPPLDAAIEAINAAKDATWDAGKDFREEVVREGILAPTESEISELISQKSAPIVMAIDVPSGLDCDTGRPSKATVRADCTITFVARKAGFAVAGAAEYCGRVMVVDIGAPPEIVEAVAAGQ